ncbi:hypothetical protein SAMN02983003_0595 [Devosia enhydra]|uniref:Uncharacterized protein n=1 Tax=Devosia enhydra TaxID=665118 RepID=A0A1K2HTS4_9HYPH|nr:hypothetical protein [Devosia enhydra]SFZ81615.1 hypothetical protein SAMN02983003_0595 [Devosia enhydra]
MPKLDDLVAQAQAEIDAEDHRAAVEARKATLRERQGRSLWRRLFPFKFTITRLDQ